jgi:hypothetical protein
MRSTVPWMYLSSADDKNVTGVPVIFNQFDGTAKRAFHFHPLAAIASAEQTASSISNLIGLSNQLAGNCGLFFTLSDFFGA